MNNSEYSKIVGLLLLPLVLSAAGCHRENVQVYSVSSDQDQTPPPLAQMPPTNSTGAPAIASLPPGSLPAASEDQSSAPLTWSTPPGWTSVTPSEMRVASFKVSGPDGKTADVSIVPLPGMAGGDAPNVNRWRGQVGLTPTPDEQILSSAESVQAGGQPATLYDIGGATSRILGVIQHRADGNAWFFKMTGDPDLVEQQKTNFLVFLNSLAFVANVAPAQLTTSQMPTAQLPPGHPEVGQADQSSAQLPPGHPEIGAMDSSSAGPINHAGQPTWQVPADWTEVSGGQFLVGKFIITADGGATAAVNVSSSAGTGGGVAPNVNRWRGQIGLQPKDSLATTPLTVAAGQAQLVDLTGMDARTSQPSEIIGVIVTESSSTWFYKLMGDPKVVAAQKQAFTQFVQGVKY
ncbi:MAG TPA: hypothetical protein VGI03_04830 [Verrucomicrobiae bacterium]|jgi:hypothetical protein